MQNIKEEYSNGEVTVVWKPKLCSHSTICWKPPVCLPEVYNPKAKPWINTDNSPTEKIVTQVKKCPTGALSFYMNKDVEKKVSENIPGVIEVVENGPLIVYGNIELTDSAGNKIEKDTVTSFCRCGASSNKPYCDGSHLYNNFKG